MDYKKISAFVFASVLFLYALTYISSAKAYVAYFINPVIGYSIVYVSAFVDFAIATSIVTKQQTKKVCFYGGWIWLLTSIITIFYEIANGTSSQWSQYFLQLISAVGFDAAIFYISATSEE